MRVSAAGLRDAVLGELLGPREGAGPLRARRAERGAGGLQARRKREWAARRGGLGLGWVAKGFGLDWEAGWAGLLFSISGFSFSFLFLKLT